MQNYRHKTVRTYKEYTKDSLTKEVIDYLSIAQQIKLVNQKYNQNFSDKPIVLPELKPIVTLVRKTILVRQLDNLGLNYDF